MTEVSVMSSFVKDEYSYRVNVFERRVLLSFDRIQTLDQIFCRKLREILCTCFVQDLPVLWQFSKVVRQSGVYKPAIRERQSDEQNNWSGDQGLTHCGSQPGTALLVPFTAPC